MPDRLGGVPTPEELPLRVILNERTVDGVKDELKTLRLEFVKFKEVDFAKLEENQQSGRTILLQILSALVIASILLVVNIIVQVAIQ